MAQTYGETAPARLATRLAFFAAGFTSAAIAPMVPFLKQNVGVSVGQFGMLLLCLGLGAVVAMPITGVLAARFGARPMVLLGGFAGLALLPLLPLMSAPLALGAVVFAFGAALGTTDVAMNVHGAEVEGIEARPLMSNFHAFWNIGGLGGAGLLTLMLTFQVPLTIGTLVISAIALAAMAMTVRRLRTARSEAPVSFALPRGIVLLLAALAGIVFLVEGAILDWSALLIIERQLADVETAGLGYILFSLAMIAGRLTGDRVVARFGGFRVFLIGGLTAVTGILVVLLVPLFWLALAGFLLIGLGAANLVPIVFSAAGRQKIMPAGLAVASVTTTGYAGVLMGPALVGLTAQATSLPVAFGVLALLMALVPLSARLIARI